MTDTQTNMQHCVRFSTFPWPWSIKVKWPCFKESIQRCFWAVHNVLWFFQKSQREGSSFYQNVCQSHMSQNKLLESRPAYSDKIMSLSGIELASMINGCIYICTRQTQIKKVQLNTMICSSEDEPKWYLRASKHLFV